MRASAHKLLQRFELSGKRCMHTVETLCFDMPKHTEIVCFGEEFNQPYLYVLVDPDGWDQMENYGLERTEHIVIRRFLCAYADGLGDRLECTYLYGEQLVLDPVMPGVIVLDSGATRMFLFEVL